MKSASKAGPDEVVRKFLDNHQPNQKQAYSIRISPCIEYDASGDVVNDSKTSKTSPLTLSGTCEADTLKAILGLLGDTIKLARNL